MRLIQLFLFTLLFAASSVGKAQDQVIDEIVAVVGDNIVLRSDLEAQRLQALSQGINIDDEAYCFILEELLFQKLLLHQADLDSVEVGEAQIQGELDRRMRYFIQQLGSVEKLEEFYGQDIISIKAELHDVMEDQLRAQQVQQSLTANIKVTPSEVKEYFESIPADSLPRIDAEVEIAHIVRKPVVSEQEREFTIRRLNDWAKDVREGRKNFEDIAILYSEDPGSAPKGGRLGFTPRTALVPEFAAVAFNLSPGEVSEVVETQFGFHIIQMIERRGEEIDCRHILLKPKINPQAYKEAQQFLDSIADLIAKDSISFEAAAAKYSDDVDSRNSNGVIVNPYTGASRFSMDEIDGTTFYAIDKLKEGELSKPVLYQTAEGNAYRLVRLNVRTKPHKANMQDDYQLLQNAALNEKRGKAIEEWLNTRINSSYVKIVEKYQSCEFQAAWVKGS